MKFSCIRRILLRREESPIVRDFLFVKIESNNGNIISGTTILASPTTRMSPATQDKKIMNEGMKVSFIRIY